MFVISKQLVCQKFIYKIHSSRLRKTKWNLNLPLDEARRNDEVIALADSQMLRWIDEINNVVDADDKAKDIKNRIAYIKRQPNSLNNRRIIKQLYKDLDELQFKPDYMCLIIDRDKDYRRACKGFRINGITYKRLVGTVNGVKNSTIVFVNEKLVDELRRRIDNGRNLNKEAVPAKLEAYRSLPCSASIPVSMPNGVIVVDDVEVDFVSDIVYLNDECSGEPEMTYKHNEPVHMDVSDGYGLMLPSLSLRWSEELGLDYMMSGCNTRNAFEKGMVFTFDFLDFAERVAGTYIIKDAWGHEQDLRNVELILTTSMLKLWDSYESCDEYIRNCVENHYTFGVTKTCPKELESERNLNYQFIQSYTMTDDDIDELILPTVNEINDVLHGDWAKTILFLKGVGITESSVDKFDDDYIKSIMIDPRMIDDPYVVNNVYQLIKNRINEAKVGVLKVHGNYSIASGDPYSLCQSMFGLEVTGLLKSGEIYNKYWLDSGSNRLACYRAPMSCHCNIRRVNVHSSEDAKYWYQYMTTCTIMNSWDTATAALNGMDYDGDLVMLTDNRVLVDNIEEQPALFCIQRKAEKMIPTEEDFVEANIKSFGNEIGQTTNWITSMFEVQSYYDKDSKEFQELEYRIKCGQLYQQNVIDKSKGIVAKSMPRNWHDIHVVNKMEDGEEKSFYRSIVADKKPYFMRYIYPALSKDYNTYIKNTNKNSLREFGITVDELKNIPECNRTDRQNEFLRYYDLRIPVGVGDCVMNRICRKIEDYFDGYVGKHNSEYKFDYTIMKNNSEYSVAQYNAIRKLYDEYNKKLRGYTVFAEYEKIEESDFKNEIAVMNDEFKRECEATCPNVDILSNIVLDICYTRSATKRFAWNICGNAIINNLLRNNDYTINFPMIDENGTIEYCANKFSLNKKVLEVRDEYYS
ncbi:MAG: hypothetical protein KBS82_05520 [Oscillospiraceae bacterium]|nr:hypothetical protein [Candidatus Limimonas egerieequi]